MSNDDAVADLLEQAANDARAAAEALAQIQAGGS